jgi:hypothetical protein
MKTWTRPQLKEFLSRVRGDRFYAAYLLALAPACGEARF